jgi:hypothetical protein
MPNTPANDVPTKLRLYQLEDSQDLTDETFKVWPIAWKLWPASKRRTHPWPTSLAAAKARGMQLGTAGAANIGSNIEARQATADAHTAKLSGMIIGMQARGMSQRAMVAELNALGIKTSTGKENWTLSQLQRVLARLPAANVLN